MRFALISFGGNSVVATCWCLLNEDAVAIERIIMGHHCHEKGNAKKNTLSGKEEGKETGKRREEG